MTRPCPTACQPMDMVGNAEQTLAAELRADIQSILFAADKPMPTTAITAAVHQRCGRVPGHLIYQALVALERDAEARRAGRAGTAARPEVLWQLARAARLGEHDDGLVGDDPPERTERQLGAPPRVVPISPGLTRNEIGCSVDECN
jgi:hypothetical protein